MIQTSLQIDEPGFMVGSVYTLCHSFNCPGLVRAVRWSFISEQTAFSTNITPSCPYPLPSSSSPTASKRLTKVHNEFKRDLLLREVVLSPGEKGRLNWEVCLWAVSRTFRADALPANGRFLHISDLHIVIQELLHAINTSQINRKSKMTNSLNKEEYLPTKKQAVKPQL